MEPLFRMLYVVRIIRQRMSLIGPQMALPSVFTDGETKTSCTHLLSTETPVADVINFLKIIELLV